MEWEILFQGQKKPRRSEALVVYGEVSDLTESWLMRGKPGRLQVWVDMLAFGNDMLAKSKH